MNEYNKLITSTKGLKVLYVEDSKEVMESTLDFLKIFFMDITIGVDGIDALEKFEEEEFDIIISDIGMPRLNGLDLIEKIKEIDPEVSIVVLSGHSSIENLLEADKKGIDGYMVKPLVIDEFILYLNNIVKKREKSINNL